MFVAAAFVFVVLEVLMAAAMNKGSRPFAVRRRFPWWSLLGNDDFESHHGG